MCEGVSYSGGIYMVHMHQVANLKTQMEAQKLESIKYLAGGLLVVECSFQLLDEPSHFPLLPTPRRYIFYSHHCAVSGTGDVETYEVNHTQELIPRISNSQMEFYFYVITNTWLYVSRAISYLYFSYCIHMMFIRSYFGTIWCDT